VKLTAGNVPAIYTTSIANSGNIEELKVEGYLFNQAVEYTPGKFIIRQYAKAHRDYLIRKIDKDGEVIAEQPVIPAIIIPDDGMSSQGTLLFSEKWNRVYYVHKLFNNVLCLDTSLN